MSSYHETKLGHNDGASSEDVEITMKKYTDTLLHAVEGISSRLLKLESRACVVENSVDDLKVSIENRCGSTNGKLTQLENILREVQTSLQLLRDKQKITDAHLQLARLQISESDHKHSKTFQGIPDLPQQLAPPQLQQPQQPTVISLSQPTPPPLPPLNAPPPPPQPQHSSAVQFPPQLPQQHQLPSVPSLSQGHTYPIPSNHIQQYSQLAQYSQPLLPEDANSYMPSSQPHPTNIHQPILSSQSPQHYLGASPIIYELPGTLSFPSSYGRPEFAAPHPYSSPSHSSMNQSRFASLPTTSGGSSSYQRLPQTAAVGLSSSSGDNPTVNKVSIDEVIDKVATMGFSRDQVRGTVRKLTENGQSVDLNAVLDKLMNSGEQPQKGWFQR